MDVEVEYGAPAVFPLPMGIGREDGHERAGLQTWKGPWQHIGSEFEVSQAATVERPNLR